MEWVDFDVEVFPETDLFDFVVFCAPKTDFDGTSEVSVPYADAPFAFCLSST